MDPHTLPMSECVGAEHLRCRHLQTAARGSARHNPAAICQTKMSAPGFRMVLIYFLYECFRQRCYPLASRTTALYYTSSSGRLSEVIALKALLYIVQPDSIAYQTGCGCGGDAPGNYAVTHKLTHICISLCSSEKNPLAVKVFFFFLKVHYFPHSLVY